MIGDGIEPPTLDFSGRRSTAELPNLCWLPTKVPPLALYRLTAGSVHLLGRWDHVGAYGRLRSRDLPVRSRVLCPAELRKHNLFSLLAVLPRLPALG